MSTAAAQASAGRAIRFATERPWFVAALATSFTLVIVALRAIADGIQLTDERSYFETRSYDVLTDDHPWLGTRVSTASMTGEFNHPGPLMFDLFALPVRLFGGSVGVTLGAVAVNVLAVWLAVRAARDVGGTDAATVAAVGAALLCWTLGTERLVDPWGPHQLVLAFYALLMMTAAVVGGAGRWLPVAVAMGSLSLQTNVGFVILVPGLVAAGVVALLVWWRWLGAHPPWRTLLLSAGVGFVLWFQPLWQQLFGPGAGNVSGILEGAENEGGTRAGAGVATRLLVDIVAVPPAWIGPTYESAPPELKFDAVDAELRFAGAAPSLGAAVLVGMVLVGLAVWCVVAARRRGVAATTPMLIVAGATIVMALPTISSLPVDWGGIPAHKFRYLWAVGAFVSVAFVVHIVGMVRRRGWSLVAWLSPTLVVAVVVLSVATVPVRAEPGDGTKKRDAWPVIEELRSQLDADDLHGKVLVETTGLPFPEYFVHPVIAELTRQGVDFDVSNDVAATQYGETRRDDGTATSRVFLRIGGDAGATPPGSRQLAFVDGGADELTVGVYVEPREAVPADS